MEKKILGTLDISLFWTTGQTYTYWAVVVIVKAHKYGP